ncbi:MAG: transporter substrate-binding domain-containing protein [Bacteroidota bacterium]
MKNFLILLFFISSIPTFGQKYSGSSWAQVKASRSGTLSCLFYKTPKLVFRDSDGQIKGVCVDILNDFSKYVKKKYNTDLNIEFVGEETSFMEFMKQVNATKNVLGVANVSITPARQKQMKFSPAYLSNLMIMLTHKDAPTINSLDELSSKLNGYTGMVISGTTHVEYIQSLKSQYYPGLKLSYQPSGGVIIDAISKDSKNFAILEFTEYFDAIKNRKPVKRQDVYLNSEKEELGFVMSKSSDWDGVWKEFLTDDYKSSMRYKEIIADNLGNAFLRLIR